MKKSFFNTRKFGRADAIAACAAAGLALVAFPAAAQTLTGVNVGHISLDITGNHPSVGRNGTMRLIIQKRVDMRTAEVVWNYRLTPIPVNDAIQPTPLPAGSVAQDARTVRIGAPLNVTVDVVAKSCTSTGHTCAVNRLEVYKSNAQQAQDNKRRLELEKYCAPYTPPSVSQGSEVGIVSVNIQEKSPQGALINSEVRYRKMGNHWRSIYSKGTPITNATPKQQIPFSSVSTVSEQITFNDRGLNVFVVSKFCNMRGAESCKINYVRGPSTNEDREEAAKRAMYANDCPKK